MSNRGILGEKRFLQSSFSSPQNSEDMDPYSWSPNFLRYQAHSLVRKPLLRWEYTLSDVIPYIIKYAQIYSKKVEDKIIVLGNDQNDDVINIPYKTRFSKDYGDTVKNKLVSVFKKLNLAGYKKFQFLTITADPNLYGSLADAFQYLSKVWNILLTRLRKRYPKIFIIKTVELQKNGFPHLHVLIAGVGYIPFGWIRKTALLGTQFIKMKYLHGYDVPGAYSYILKYILKSIGDLNNPLSSWNFTQRALFWATFSRSYSTSRLSLNSYKTNSNQLIEEDGIFVKNAWYLIGFLSFFDIVGDPPRKRDEFYYQKYKNYS